jgi:hypothetical protein
VISFIFLSPFIRFLSLSKEINEQSNEVDNYVKGLKTKSISYCYQLKDLSYKTKCFEVVAISNKNQAACAEIEISAIRTRCISLAKGDYSACNLEKEPDTCYSDVARYTSNAQLCENIRGIKDYCYKDVAEESGNPSLCVYVSDENNNKNCMAVAKRDGTYCSKITDRTSGDWCYANVVTYNGDSSLCENIINEVIKNSCYNFAKFYRS